MWPGSMSIDQSMSVVAFHWLAFDFSYSLFRRGRRAS